jgi:AmmeMemoRadiSam system protein A
MSDDHKLTPDEQRQLLTLARWAIERAVHGEDPFPSDWQAYSPRLQEKGVCFVTLTHAAGALRGCIGGLEPTQPLARDVCEHAAAAALEDYRFLPVRADEVASLHIEISRLTLPESLLYEKPEDLPLLLHPGSDGVVLHDGFRRATFLPQVWQKIPDPEGFLSALCEKMGVSENAWRKRKLRVEIYHVEEFEEERPLA